MSNFSPSDLPPDESDQPIDPRHHPLAGEPAPEISVEDFARLQRQGAIHIDPQGRIRANRQEDSDPGVSLRKRRAWYSCLTPLPHSSINSARR